MCTICQATQTFDPARHTSNDPANANVFEGVDAAGDSSTTYSMGVGDSFFGGIGTNTDTDWVQVTLTAGTTYVFDAVGDGNGSTSGYDTDLTLFNSGGTQLAYDDASGAGFDAQLTYTATSTGTYYIQVSSFNSINATGNYTLGLSEAALPSAGTIQELADFLKDGSTGVGVIRKFDTSTSNQITVDISGLEADGQQLALWAMEAWEMVVNIDFVVQTDGVQGNEMITVDDEDDGAFAYYPNSGSTSTSGPDPDNTDGVELNVSKQWLINNGTTLDSYSFQTYVHEFGHAIGLTHLGDYNGSASFPSDATFGNDSWQTSVMSYFSQTENTLVNASFGYLAGPMMADILAIQDMYGTPGASTATAGDTTYGLGSNLGNYLDEIFTALAEGTPNVPFAGNNMAFTLYDHSGIDTINVSTLDSSDAAIVDLNDGTFSDFGTNIGVMGIAIGTIIENFISGAANDNITGNEANNTIQGGLGEDTLTGGIGNDMLMGDGGNDTAVYSSNAANYTTLTYGGYQGIIDTVGNEGGDLLQSVESIAFDDGTIAASSITTGFEALRYIASHADLIGVFGANGISGFSHYVTNGLSEGRGITFDAFGYLASHADLLAIFGGNTEAASGHYISYGAAEGRGITFNALAYIASHADLIAVFGANAEAGTQHYVQNGAAEGRGITFDAFAYIASHADLLAVFGANGAAATQHYIQYGAGEGRAITFNGLEYIASHADLIGVFGSDAGAGTLHYVQYGAGEGRAVTFSGLEYIASHADLIAVFGIDAGAGALHYITSGFGEGRATTFSGLEYLTSHLDLLQVFGTDVTAATQHYIQYGAGEGRATDARGAAGLDAIENIITGDSVLSGTAQGDLLFATGGAGGTTQLNGNAGDDILIGDAGANVMNGGADDDLMLGGAGSDFFDFTDTSGNDTIADFDTVDNFEVINFSNVTEITSFQDLLDNHTDDTANGLLITYGSNTLTLTGVTEAQLNSNDFLFGSA